MATMAATLDSPLDARPASYLAMQQRYGNRAVQRLLQRDINDAPTTTSSFDLNTVRGLFKHLARLYHPDKARSDDEIPWRSDLMRRIIDAHGAGDLAALKRLQSEGATRTNSQSPTTEVPESPPGPRLPNAPTIPPTMPSSEVLVTAPDSAPTTSEPSNQLAPLPSVESGPLVPVTESSALTIVPPQVIEEVVRPNPEPTGPEDVEPGTTPEPPAVRRTSLKMQTFAHNQRALPFLKKFMTEQNALRSYNFYFDAGGNRDVYRKYIADGAAQQVQLRSDVKAKLDELARVRNWGAMGPDLDRARASNQSTINNDILPQFEQSPYYEQFKAVVPDQPLLTRALNAFKSREPQGPKISNFGPQLPRQMAVTNRTVGVLEQAIERYTPFFRNGKRTLDQVGLPTDPREVERLYRQGLERHQRVVGVFTRRYARDRTFRPELYAAFFNKLQAFTRLWTEYKTQLGR
jgi:hypothetical protein